MIQKRFYRVWMKHLKAILWCVIDRDTTSHTMSYFSGMNTCNLCRCLERSSPVGWALLSPFRKMTAFHSRNETLAGSACRQQYGVDASMDGLPLLRRVGGEE
jgi:hypothetical protein